MIAFIPEDEADFLDDDDLQVLHVRLAAFLLQDEPWRAKARCRGLDDPSVFFPARGQSSRAAKLICEGCRVQSECHEYATRTGSEYGVWGGVLLNEKSISDRGAA